MYLDEIDLMDGPSAVELALIEVEWPEIERGLAELDAELVRLVAVEVVDELAVRRARRVARRRLAGAVVLGGAA